MNNNSNSNNDKDWEKCLKRTIEILKANEWKWRCLICGEFCSSRRETKFSPGQGKLIDVTVYRCNPHNYEFTLEDDPLIITEYTKYIENKKNKNKNKVS